MANTLIRMLKRDVRRQIRNYILDMIPEKVRKIVGLILLIFGAVVMLWSWYAQLSYGLFSDQMGIITAIVGLLSIVWGVILLTHKG